MLIVVIAGGLVLVLAVPITVGTAFAPSMRPIHDLAEGTKRVAAGDYTQRLPVAQDDDLGVLSASFNRMQAGWPSGDDSTQPSAPMSIPHWRPACWIRATMCSPVNGVR